MKGCPSDSTEEGECSSSDEDILDKDTTLPNMLTCVRKPGKNNMKRIKQNKMAKKQRKRKKRAQDNSSHQSVSHTLQNNDLREFYSLSALLHSDSQYNKLVSDLISNTPLVSRVQKNVYSVRDLQRILIQLLRRRDSLPSVSSVVFVWLAQVSADQVKEHWPAFEVIFPTDSTQLLHFMNPGSEKFVRPGYEEILLIQDFLGTVKRPQSTPTPGRIIPSYLLSEKEMELNSFPLLCTCPDYLPIAQVAAPDLTDDTAELLALDCEFCDTASGKALTRISVVDRKLECVYDSYVMPAEEITDYKTQYSGINARTLEGVTTCLKDVQQKLESLLTERTVLVGHSLENDLRVLRLRFSHVIDTSILLTPASTPTSKPSLRYLAQEVLHRDIQKSPSGHDSIQDATVCMELLLAKLEKGAECAVSWNDDKLSLVEYMGYCGMRSLLVDHQALLGRHTRSQSVRCSFAQGDDNIVNQAVEGMKQSAYDFTWLQLHDFHSLSKRCEKEGEELSSAVARKYFAEMLRLVGIVYNRCRPGTMMVVCAGSGNLSEIKQLHSRGSCDMKQLKVLVERARHGVAFFKFKPHDDTPDLL